MLTSTFPRWKGDHEPPFVFELSRRLAAEFDIHVLAPHAPGAQTQEVLDGMTIHRFRYCLERWEVLAYQGGIMANLKRGRRYYLLVPFFLAFQVLALLGRLRRERYDAIHAHWLIPQGLAALAARRLAVRKFPPFLCTSHGTDLLGLPGALFTFLKQQVLRRANAITVVSQAMKDHVQQMQATASHAVVVPMGIDASGMFTPPQAADANRSGLLFVGRLVQSKGVDRLIAAMPAILAQQAQAILTIAGDGPELSRLQSMAAALQLGDRVRFLGAVPNPELPQLYRRAAVFVSPSLSEGFGLTLAEALACECAVVASDLPAVREIVRDGETGMLVPAGDTAKMADAVLALLAAPAQRQKLGRAGRDSVCRRFDWQVTAAEYASLLHRLTSVPLA